MAVVAGRRRRDESAEDDDRRDAERGRGVMQAALRRDEKRSAGEDAGSLADVCRRDETDALERAHARLADLQELLAPELALERFPSLETPILIRARARLYIRLEDDAAAGELAELALRRREIDLAWLDAKFRPKDERLRMVAIVEFGVIEIGTATGKVIEELDLLGRRRDAALEFARPHEARIALPDRMPAREAVSIAHGDAARILGLQAPRLGREHDFVAPSHYRIQRRA
jgi:hypothetical protein